MKYKISFIITGLGTGGAEMMLYKLLSRINRSFFSPEVISLLAFDSMMEKFMGIEVPVKILGMPRGIPDPRGMYRLTSSIRQAQPHLVQTWMYHADLLGGLAAKFSGNMPIVWNIRHSNLDHGVNKKSTILTAKACAWLSQSLPKKIVCCADAARRIHEGIGYDASKMVVIPNGFDLTEFKNDSNASMDVRRECGIAQESPIIGLVARFHPQKDHGNFFRAAKLLKDWVPDAHFILCGDGISLENPELKQMIDVAGLRNSLHLLGPRKDVQRLTSAFDIAASSSCGEGFSNTIGEAMACEVPCVVTDVGDSGFIVGDSGKVVPHGNPEAFAKGCKTLIDLGRDGRKKLGYLARQRVLRNFSLDSVVEKYESLYLSLLIPNEPQFHSEMLRPHIR